MNYTLAYDDEVLLPCMLLDSSISDFAVLKCGDVVDIVRRERREGEGGRNVGSTPPSSLPPPPRHLPSGAGGVFEIREVVDSDGNEISSHVVDVIEAKDSIERRVKDLGIEPSKEEEDHVGEEVVEEEEEEEALSLVEIDWDELERKEREAEMAEAGVVEGKGWGKGFLSNDKLGEKKGEKKKKKKKKIQGPEKTAPDQQLKKAPEPAPKSPQHPTFQSNGLRVHFKPPKKPASGQHVHWPSSPEEMRTVKEIPNENRGTPVPSPNKPLWGIFDEESSSSSSSSSSPAPALDMSSLGVKSSSNLVQSVSRRDSIQLAKQRSSSLEDVPSPPPRKAAVPTFPRPPVKEIQENKIEKKPSVPRQMSKVERRQALEQSKQTAFNGVIKESVGESKVERRKKEGGRISKFKSERR
ncbi:hypothetical protein TrVE_jg2940 [Triparma verrucosa]|uniref:Uncharacterized protein n=1 Tax=Triparma verrucosa TaxID=1606542 RepID=A0A9W7KW89_9STRA|nr:hypothetical protein TrVE_jg2940 [Triparma verrucosa]